MLFYAHLHVSMVHTVFKANKSPPFPYELVCTLTACGLKTLWSCILLWAIIEDFMIFMMRGISTHMWTYPTTVISDDDVMLC